MKPESIGWDAVISLLVLAGLAAITGDSYDGGDLVTIAVIFLILDAGFEFLRSRIFKDW